MSSWSWTMVLEILGKDEGEVEVEGLRRQD